MSYTRKGKRSRRKDQTVRFTNPATCFDASKKAANIFKASIMEELTLLTENYQKLKAELLTAKYEKSQIAQENFFRVS